MATKREMKAMSTRMSERKIRQWPETLRWDVFRLCKIAREKLVNEKAQDVYEQIKRCGARGAVRVARDFRTYVIKTYGA